MPAEAPSAIGRYEIRRELGRGMMGVVYEAHDPVLGRDIALKVIQLGFSPSEEDRQSFEQRFFAEARAAARLSHPGIVVVHDVGRDAASGGLYMALELLRGQTLDRVLKERGPLDWREALRIVQRVAEALQHAHASNVVHRDVKPANIMLSSSGEPKIMDFGIAKLEASQLTASGQFLGTPLYMSPEQALAHPVDGRSDVFSLGSVLYEMLTGRQAFAGETVTKIIYQVVGREPEPVSVVAHGIPESIDYLLARCLAKDVARRYVDGHALAEDIEDVLAGRQPRGRASWQPPVQAQGTLIGGVAPPAPPQEPAPPPTAVPTKASAPARRAPLPSRPPAAAQPSSTPRSAGRPIVAAVIGVLIVAAVIVGVLLLRSGADSTSTPVARRIAPTSEETARGVPTTDAGTGDGKGEDTKANAGVTATTARLLIDFEHSLKSGTFRVWVDDHPVLEETIGGRITHKVGGIEMRKGRASDALEVLPGRREVKVQVSWEDNVKTESAWANFKGGSTLRLKAHLGSLAGLKKDLSLEWY